MSALEDGVSQSRVVPPARPDTRMRRRSAKYSSTAVVSFAVVADIAIFYAIIERDCIPVQGPCHPAGMGHEDDENGQEGRYDCKRIPYWIDRRLTCFARPEYDASISFGLTFEPEHCQFGKSRIR